MKPVLRYTLSGIALATMAALLCVLLSLSSAQRHMQTCSGLKVEFADGLGLVSDEEVKQCLEKNYGSYVGQRLDSVDLHRMESILNSCGAVSGSEAYTTPDGMLHVQISERRPVLVLASESGQFHLDATGCIFPVTGEAASGLMTVGGKLPLSLKAGYKGLAGTPEERKWIASLLDVVSSIREDKVWKESFVGINVNANGDLVLTPRYGKESFIFGEMERTEEKLAKIGKYYEYIRPSAGENKYRTVNVKYSGQIVCREK